MKQPGYVLLLAAALTELVCAASIEEPAHLLPRSLTAKKQHLAKRSGTRPKGTLSKSQGCTRYHTVKSGDTCYGLAEDWGISPWTDFLEWNTSLDEDCQTLIIGYSYCMAVKSTTSSSASSDSDQCSATTTTTTTTTKATKTATSTKSTNKDNQKTTSTSSATPTSSKTSTKCSTSTGKSSSKSASQSASATSSASYPFETRNGVFQTGIATWYYTGLGACGVTNTDDQLVAAVSWEVFDNWPGADYYDPYNNPLCGKKLQARYGSKTVTATVRDRCASCEATHIDLSPSAFADLADLDEGMIDVKWKWLK